MEGRGGSDRSMQRRKWIALAGVILIALVMGVGGLKALQTKNKIKALFKMNKALQEENYYMAEFEFKMLGIAYCLDKGAYRKGFGLLDRLYAQLSAKKNLIKMPAFASKAEELDFYLSLQNPNTGAFMDDAYPLCSYHGPTENVLLHLDALAKAIGQPLTLKYPLSYLDAINTPEKLVAFLDDVSTVGWLAARLPQTTFHNARDILSLARDPLSYDADRVNLVISENKLYPFSAQWRRTLLQWFYDHQDPETGLWGPKSKGGKLRKRDLNNTASIMKAFVDEDGNDIHAAFPLRHKAQLFQSILAELSAQPIPADDALHEWHEWQLRSLKGIRTLTRYLWKDASADHKARAATLIEDFVRVKYERFYIPAEGGFSFYPGGQHATLDGMGGFSILKEIGAFSPAKQARLWGPPQKSIIDLGTLQRAELTAEDFKSIVRTEGLNSLRFYKTSPDYAHLTSGVAAVVYPKETAVLDIMELTEKVKLWIDTTPQTMGNWKSKAEVRESLASIEMESAPVYKEVIPVEGANRILRAEDRLVVIGFDTLQVPRVQMVFKVTPP